MFVACLRLITWILAPRVQGSVCVLFHDLLWARITGSACNRCSVHTCWGNEWKVFKIPWSRMDVSLPTCGDGPAGPHKCTEQCKRINLSLPCSSVHIQSKEGLTWGFVEFMALLPMPPAAPLMRPLPPPLRSPFRAQSHLATSISLTPAYLLVWLTSPGTPSPGSLNCGYGNETTCL